MLTILLTSDAFLPIRDGVGRVVYEYAQALGTRGHECYVVAPMSDAGYRPRHPFEIVDFHSIAIPGTPHYRTGIASMDKHYMARIATVKPDIIHAHSPGPAGMEAVRLSSKLKVPLIGTFHSKFYDDFLQVTRSEGLAALGVRYVVDFFDRCDEVWTVSRFAADTLREYGYRGRVEIVQNGVRMEYSQHSREFGAKLSRTTFGLSSAPVLLYVGQMDWKKNLRCVLTAAALLQKAGFDFQLVMAGGGKDAEEIQEFGYSLLPKDVLTFTGHISSDRLLTSLYQAATLFVFPSAYDTAGLVVREAAAVGTPSIVLRGAAPAEVIRHGENGLTCENTPNSLSDTIAQAMANPTQLLHMGEKARAEIPIPWNKVMDEVTERYQTIVDRENVILKRKRGIFRRELTAMDHTLEKRTMDMTWRFLKQDWQHVYAYEYYPQKGAVTFIQSKPLPRSTPEEQGMDSLRVAELFRALDGDEDARVQGAMVIRGGHVIAEGYWEPYDKSLPHQLYSLSKSVTATAIGMLWGEGKLKLTERLVDIFEDVIENKETHPMWECTIWHLLTMSTGARFNEVGSALGNDWVKEFMQGGVRFPAGAQFHYNSMNTYMLAAIVKRKAGCGLMEYLKPRLFEPLEISGATWEVCPMGIEKGGWGLSLQLEDVAKIGLLYLQEGEYIVQGHKKRLLSAEWVREATKVQIETPHGECKDGYGYQIWMAPKPGAYLFNGAFGQYMLAMPEEHALISIFSGTSRLFAQGDVMRYVLNCFSFLPGEEVTDDPRRLRVLENTVGMLSVSQRQKNSAENMMPMPFQALREQLDGMSCNFSSNIAGIFPVVLQTIHNNYGEGITTVSFEALGENGMKAVFHEGQISNVLQLAAGEFVRGQVTVRQETYAVSTGMEFGMLANGDVCLQLFLYFLETPCVRVFTFTFREDAVTLVCDEDPSINNAATMLMELSGVTQTELLRALVPLLKRESLQNRIRTYTTSTIKGNIG